MDKKPGQPRWPGSCWKNRGSDEEQKAGSVTGDVREAAVGLEKYEREKRTRHSISDEEQEAGSVAGEV